MRSISDNLVVLIPLLAAKIQEMRLELRAIDEGEKNLSEEELENRVQLQDMLRQYETILDDMREEYERGLAEGIRLPTFEELTARFQID